MELRTTYFFLPYLLVYTDKLPDNVGGRANGPLVRIKNKYQEDKGLHAHEEEHVWQWYITLFTHPLWYRFVRKYRRWSEAKAFAVQVRHGADTYQMARRMASDHYDLKMTIGRAVMVIRSYV